MSCVNVCRSDWRKRKEDVLVAEQHVLAAPAFLNRSIDEALCRFTNLVLCDVEVHDATSC
jgi:hypothetical protein